MLLSSGPGVAPTVGDARAVPDLAEYGNGDASIPQTSIFGDTKFATRSGAAEGQRDASPVVTLCLQGTYL